MTHDLGTKVDLILSSLDGVNLKLESINAVVVNKELYLFIWKGKEKVKHSALIHDIDHGGLKMPDLESMISAQSHVCKEIC